MGVEHRDFDEFLKKVDLGGHVWCRNQGIEDTGASICEIHSVFQMFDSDISKFVWYWRLHSYKLSCIFALQKQNNVIENSDEG